MKRTQIQLTEEQVRMAKRLAAERQVSTAEVIRDGLDRLAVAAGYGVSAEERVERAKRVAGRFGSGSADGSTRHDAHLAEAYRQ